MNLEEIFKINKPIIGDIHLPPLPGSPKYTSNSKLQDFVDFAINETKIYAENKFDGVILENYGDVPYYPDKVGPETVAMMTYIARNIVEKVKIPIGIQVMWNDPISSISIAHVIGGKFIRVNNLKEKTHEIQKFKKSLGVEDVKIFADIEYMHVGNVDIADVAEDLAYRDLADVIIISSGLPAFRDKRVDMMVIEKLKNRKALSEFPIFVAGGVNKNNVKEYLNISDGIIVATSLKVDGITTNPTDPQRAKEFMERVNEVR